MALGYVKAEAHDPGADYAIELLGTRRPARVQAEPLFDPNGERMRG